MNYSMYGNEEYCSSGCESGWTLYLDQSSISRDNDHFLEHQVCTDEKRSNEEEEDEEDLSMVSDASSGPPHLHEEEEDQEAAGYAGAGINHKNGCSFYDEPVNRLKRNKNREINRCRNKAQDLSSLLDDTASSPLLQSCNKTSSQPSSVENLVEYSQGYSTTQFEVIRPPYQEQYYDFFQSGNQLQQQNHRWFEGKRW